MPKPIIDPYYDIVIIGAGPAGLNSCLHVLCAKPGPSVLLLDKTTPWERPIACAEGVGRLGFSEALTPDPSWIRHNISHASFHAPDGTVVVYSDFNKGYIIDRARLQHDLAQRCRALGVRVVLDTRVTAVSTPDRSGRRTIQIEGGTATAARVVIDASGPLSSLGRGEGISWKPVDLEPAFFVILDGVEHESDTVHIHMGRQIAPCGYAWSFPGRDRQVNAGVLVGSRVGSAVNIRRLLESFISSHFHGAKVVRYFGGSIPCGYQRNAIAIHGLIKAGDAASTTNPISRAGIVEALMSGALAGDAAIEMLGCAHQRAMERICRAYERSWYEKRGKRHEKLSRVKGDLGRIPDADFTTAARTLSAIPRSRRTMATIFRVSVGRFPRLVWALRHLM